MMLFMLVLFIIWVISKIDCDCVCDNPEPVVAEPVVAEPFLDPFVEPFTEPMEEPVTELVEEPVIEPVIELVEELVEEPVEEPVIELVEEPVEEPVIVEESFVNPRFFIFNQTQNNTTTENNSININIKNNNILFHTYSY